MNSYIPFPASRPDRLVSVAPVHRPPFPRGHRPRPRGSLMIHPRRRRAGWIQAVMAGLLLFILVASAISKDFRGFLIERFAMANTINSAALTTQGNLVMTGVQEMVAKGWATCEITWNTSADNDGNWRSSDIFNPVTGGYIRPPATVSDITVGPDLEAPGVASAWYFHCGIRVGGSGDDQRADLIAVYPNLKEGACRKINEKANGADPLADPPEAGTAISAAAWTTGNVASPPLASATGIDGNSYGCVRSSDGYYVYYHVLGAI